MLMAMASETASRWLFRLVRKPTPSPAPTSKYRRCSQHIELTDVNPWVSMHGSVFDVISSFPRYARTKLCWSRLCFRFPADLQQQQKEGRVRENLEEKLACTHMSRVASLPNIASTSMQPNLALGLHAATLGPQVELRKRVCWTSARI